MTLRKIWKTGWWKKTIALCGRDDVEGYIAAHTVTNLFYLMRHDYTNDERRDMLLNLLDILKVEQIDEKNNIPNTIFYTDKPAL